MHHGLVVTEYAGTLVVLVAGLLMVKSFANVRSADPGSATDRVLTLRLQLTGRAYDEPATRTAFLDEAPCAVSEAWPRPPRRGPPTAQVA